MIPDSQNIFTYIEAILQWHKPFVWFKKPYSNLLTGIIQKDSIDYSSQNLEESGFIFSPFDSDKKNVLIPSNQSDRWEIALENLEMKLPHFNGLKPSDVEKKAHIALVQKAIDTIQKGKVQKIVLSRQQVLDFESKNIIRVFQSLLQQYSEAMVYLWYHPKTGFWMGATPEKLVTLEKNNFMTMSLAGTQRYQENLVWQEKEKIEQQFVTDYIKNKLLPYSNSLDLSDVFTKKAGPLAHLCTNISGELKSGFTLENIVQQLHPTPAVCGTPREESKHFILENEGYDREFYTGFLGEINSNEKSELFVNLRCMKISDKTVRLFVGGGITAESIPEKEWEETVNKSHVLGRFLNDNY